MMSPPNNASYAATFLDQPQACGSGIRVGVAMVLRKESVLLNLAQIGAPKVMALNNCCFPILMFDIIILPKYIYIIETLGASWDCYPSQLHGEHQHQ